MKNIKIRGLNDQGVSATAVIFYILAGLGVFGGVIMASDFGDALYFIVACISAFLIFTMGRAMSYLHQIANQGYSVTYDEIQTIQSADAVQQDNSELPPL